MIYTAAYSTDNRLPLHRLYWDRNEVQLGDKILFLTKGKYISTGGFVKRLSRTQNSFVAVIDEFGNVIQKSRVIYASLKKIEREEDQDAGQNNNPRHSSG